MPLELVISGVSKTYPGDVRALRDIDLRVPTGMFGLLGPNGAGKSTLMRTVATLQEPDTGSIRLGDIDVLADKAGLRRLLGYLPQEFGVYPRISALEMLDHLAVLKGIVDRRHRKDLVDALLHQTNLWDARKRKLGTFSGGMKQRFGIAQALLGDPKLLIVDEPTAGLDPAERNRFLNLLSEVGENIVVILSTHIVEDVTDLCSQMAILIGGRVRQSGRPTDLIAALSGRVWSAVVDRAALDDLRARHDVISTHLHAGRTVVRVAAEARPDASFGPIEPTLEDVYFWTLHETQREGAAA